VAENLKFIPSEASFDPETVNLLSDAFEVAWQKVQTSGHRLARPGYANMIRGVMAKHISNLAEPASETRASSATAICIFFTEDYKVYAAQLTASFARCWTRQISRPGAAVSARAAQFCR
jgi:hypothetical protein